MTTALTPAQKLTCIAEHYLNDKEYIELRRTLTESRRASYKDIQAIIHRFVRQETNLKEFLHGELGPLVYNPNVALMRKHLRMLYVFLMIFAKPVIKLHMARVWNNQ